MKIAGLSGLFAQIESFVVYTLDKFFRQVF